MPKIVFVPQSKIARISMETLKLDIKGLYTAYSPRGSILIVKNMHCIELVHIDMIAELSMITAVSTKQIETVIQSLKEADEITLIVPEYDRTIMNRNLRNYFEKQYPNLRIVEKIIDSQHEGILVSVEKTSSNQLTSDIQPIPAGEHPQNLIHHPYEQQLQIVQKIRNIVNIAGPMPVMDINSTVQNSSTLSCIFDGCTWMHSEPSEIKFDKQESIGKKELRFLIGIDPVLVMSRDINSLYGKREDIDVMERILKNINLQNIVLPVDSNQYDSVKMDTEIAVFKSNLLKIFDNAHKDIIYNPISKEDIQFKENALAILTKSNNIFEEFSKLTSSYKQTASETTFKVAILADIKLFSKFYLDRKFYKELAFHRENEIDKALKLNKHAIELYQDKNYAAAINLFMDSLKLFTYHCTKSDHLLIKAYYNLGKTSFMAEHYSQAKFFIQTALELRKAFLPNEKSELEKVAKALQDCEAKLKQETIEEKIATLKM